MKNLNLLSKKSPIGGFRGLRLLLCGLLCVVAITANAQVVDSGSCGANLTWALTGSGSNLTLTISGTGNMENYDYNTTTTPWYSNRANIKTLVLPDGMTSIGFYAFSGCSGLTSVTIPDGVTTIGNYAFSYCSGLTEITIPEGWGVKNMIIM